jgi:hypothetical protein
MASPASTTRCLSPWRRTRSSPPDNLHVPTDPKKLHYGRNRYVGYDLSAFRYRGDLPKDIEPMAQVVVVRPILGKPKAVTWSSCAPKACRFSTMSGSRGRQVRRLRSGTGLLLGDAMSARSPLYTEDPGRSPIMLRSPSWCTLSTRTCPSSSEESLLPSAHRLQRRRRKRLSAQCAGPFGACWACGR